MSDTEFESSDEGAPVRPPRKRGLLAFFLWTAGLLVGLPVLAALSLLLWSALTVSDPVARIPPGFRAYASVPSAISFVRGALDLRALDAALSSQDLGPVRALVRTLRAAPILRSKAFDRLADLRLDAALYADGGFVAVASLGWRSAALRLLPLALRLAPGLFRDVEGLVYVDDALPPRFEYRSGGATIYAYRFRDLLVAASGPELLAASSGLRESGVDAKLASALAEGGKGTLRFLVDPSAFAAEAGREGGPLGAFLAGLEFPSLAVADLLLEDDRISLSLKLGASAAAPNLAALLGRRSRTPGALSRLPESTEYYSLLAAGRPSELWAAAEPVLGAEATSAYASADKASRLAFGMDLDALLFSWMGDELGVYGSAIASDPVFFVSIADEKGRRKAFDTAFASVVLGRDLSAVVGDTRVPRIVFPGFLRAFLETVGVKLVEPFYLVEDGFLYASASAETLAACVAEARSGKLLVKSERWKQVSAGLSPESSVSLYYSLERSIPFFMRERTGLSAALRLYGRGLANVALEKDAVRLELSAVPVARAATAMLPGYPLKEGGRMSSDPVVSRGRSGEPVAFWTSGPRIVSVELSSGKTASAVLDAPGWIAVEEEGGKIAALWAVSERGTVYRMDVDLSALPGFPLVTGQAVSGPPTISNDRLVVPVSSEPSLLLVSSDGTVRFSMVFGARSRTAPATSPHALAVLPRSFDSRLYLTDLEGAPLPGWPVALSGIASAPPIFAGDAGSLRAVAVTEAGELFAFGLDATPVPGFPVSLQGTFDAAPVWAPFARSIYAASVEGTLLRVASDGVVVSSIRLKRGPARGGSVTVFDADQDGREEIYVAGGGDALYAYSADLEPLSGYPIPGSGSPSFIDVDGDLSLDLVVRGADDSLRVYAGGRVP